jgi:hypothetical protein
LTPIESTSLPFSSWSITGTVHADDLAVLGDDGTARAAGIGVGRMLDDVVIRRPGRLTIGPSLGDDAVQQGVLRIAEGKASDVDRQAGVDIALEPLEVGIAVALDVDHRQVGALGHAQDRGVLGFGVPPDEDFEQGRSGDDVVVGHGDAGRINNEARAEAGAVEDHADLGIDKRSLRFNLDRRRLDVFQA